MLCCTVLCCAVLWLWLCCAVLYCAVLCCVVLDCLQVCLSDERERGGARSSSGGPSSGTEISEALDAALSGLIEDLSDVLSQPEEATGNSAGVSVCVSGVCVYCCFLQVTLYVQFALLCGPWAIICQV